MFDFEKLTVYQKAKAFDYLVITHFIKKQSIDKVINNQLKRASLSIALNIAEGTSRFSKADRRHFYIIARGSAFECVAIFDILRNRNNITQEEFQSFYESAEELSKMLYAMIGKLEK